MKLKRIKRAGIWSKQRACHWCKARRWTGWWIKPYGYKRWLPSCSAGMMLHLATRFTDQTSALVVRHSLNPEHVKLLDNEDENTIAIRRAGDVARTRARRAGRLV